MDALQQQLLIISLYRVLEGNRGGPREGLGDYSPSPSEGEKRFFWRFLAFIVRKTVF